MFAKQESFPVIQSMKLKNKDSTNLMKFLNEQKYRYITDNEYTNEMINSLFSLLNHVVSLTIQFSHPVSKAQLTDSKVIQIKSGLEKEIESFIQLNSNYNYNRDNKKQSNQINTNPSQKSSFDFKQSSSTSRNRTTNPITPHKTEQGYFIKAKLLSTSYKDNNKKFIFVNAMSKSNKKKEKSKSVEKTPYRNQSEYLFQNIPSIEDKKHNVDINANSNKKKKGLTEIKPSHNATKLVVQYRNVIDKYYSIKTEEQDKKKERSQSKEEVCSTFNC